VEITAANFADADKILGGYLPSIRNLTNYKGKQVALPFALSNPVMYINPDLFTAAGLDPAKPPKTWEDTLATARTIKAKTGKSPLFIQEIDNWLDQALIYSNGAQLNNADNTKVAFNGPEAIEVYTMWANAVKEGLIKKMTTKEAQASYSAGDLAMFTTSIGTLSQFTKDAKFKVMTSTLPTFGSKPQGVPCGGAGIFILAKDPAKRAAAWELAKYLISEEGLTVWVQTGYVAPTTVKVPVTPGQEVAYAQLANAKPWAWWPGGKTGLEIDRVFLDARTKIIWGEVGVKEGLDKAVADANALLK
jgi:multiple sugar transport system substrate-binding protein